jgi:hypothetical protein
VMTQPSASPSQSEFGRARASAKMKIDPRHI